MRRSEVPLPSNVAKPPRRQLSRGGAAATTNPNLSPDIMDGVMAARASPDGHECRGLESHLKPPVLNAAAGEVSADSNTIAGDKAHPAGEALVTNGAVSTTAASKAKRKKTGTPHVKVEEGESNIGAVKGTTANVTGPAETAGISGDPEAAEQLDAENEDEAEVKEALSRPPPVNSAYLPLPWKGRLGYVCDLNTLTRF